MAVNSRLKIALVAPLVTPIGPPFLGGAQVLLHDLAVGLAGRGHDVTMYAAKGSRVEGIRLIEMDVDSTELKQADFMNPDATGAAADTAFYRQGELFLDIFLQIGRGGYDIAHAHAFDWPAYAFGPLCTVPTVHTVHLPAVDPHINSILAATYRRTGSSSSVTVSQTCAATYADFFPFDRVIYNGIDIGPIPFGATPDDFLLFVGRMSPEKGADKAIEIARQAGKRLVMLGGVYDKTWFEQTIAPLLAKYDWLNYRGSVGRDEVHKWMSRAAGVLFTSVWQEPFGLVMAEALAAGAPVIAFANGAATEIIQPDVTGFLIPDNDVAAAARAVPQLAQLDRAACRASIAARFTLEKMLDEYEEYYRLTIS